MRRTSEALARKDKHHGGRKRFLSLVAGFWSAAETLGFSFEFILARRSVGSRGASTHDRSSIRVELLTAHKTSRDLYARHANHRGRET